MGYGIAAMILLLAVLPLAGWYDRARPGQQRETAFGLMMVAIVLGVVFIGICTARSN